MRPLRLPILFVSLILMAGPAASEDIAFQPYFDLRVRQEILENVCYFDVAEQDRDWVRYRARAGFSWRAGEQLTFRFRAVDEIRSYNTPSDVDFNWDELIIDRFAFEWKGGGDVPYTVTLGRQDIVWGDGFLVLDGRPLDGSRAICHNALRVKTEFDGGLLDIVGIINPMQDRWVIASDRPDDRYLRDADELAVAVRFQPADGGHLALIWKQDDDPDPKVAPFTTWTMSLALEKSESEKPGIFSELVLQRQERNVEVEGDYCFPAHACLNKQATTKQEKQVEYAFATQTYLKRTFGRDTGCRLGFFYYSWATSPYIAPYGRWPIWSEMYIYTLIGESGVANWTNISAPYLEVVRALGERVELKLRGALLFAPQPDWNRRGMFTMSNLRFRITENITGHLLWEWLGEPTWPEGQADSVHFIRWQLNYEY